MSYKVHEVDVMCN